jgi:EpsD family peptidyl-prolyl cis-trans isomerase
MRALILALGTRGDVAPLLDLGQALRQRGHEVVVLTSEIHAAQARELALDCVALAGPDREELAAIMREVAALPDRGERDMAFVQRYSMPIVAGARAELARRLAEADYAISNLPVVLRRDERGRPMPGACVTYEPPSPPGTIFELEQGEVISLVAVSPLLLNPRGALALDGRFTGFWRPARPAAPPDPQLRDFLAAGPPPVALTLGSMALLEGPELARNFGQALRRLGQRGVLVAGWGTLESVAAEFAELHVVAEVDYDWLLPQCRLVIHHGGSGTTAAVLRSGAPSILRPYIGSQLRFADQLAENGLLSASLLGQALTPELLAGAIEAGLADHGLAARAQHWRGLMAEEADGLPRAIEMIEWHQAWFARRERDFAAHAAHAATATAPGPDRRPRSGAAPARATPPLSAEQRLAQCAELAGLDQRPDVARRLAQARLDILKTAYLDTLRPLVLRPTGAEVEAFYAAHPALFAQRQIYELLSVGMSPAEFDAAPCQEALAASARLADWVDWMHNRGIPHRAEPVSQAAEDLPSGLLEALAQLGPGQRLLLNSGGQRLMYELLAKTPAPLGIAQATSEIVSFLENQQLGRLASQRLAQAAGLAKD